MNILSSLSRCLVWREIDEHELTIVEEWCFGYMRALHCQTGPRYRTR
ncbi:Uncharacterised protein [Citrobacter freundii]|nr:Uncharacterised protein [Citrobacter freundii]